MPNATLCAKAVVDMLLAKESNIPVKEVQNQLVKDGNLPKAYLVSEERMERCGRLDSVEVQDEKGVVGVREIDGMVRAQQSQKL